MAVASNDVAVVLWALMTTRSLSTVEAARLLGRDDDAGRRRARDVLNQIASSVAVRASGTGRDRRWIIDPALDVTRLTAADRVALQVGRDAVSFLRGTLLGEGLEKAASADPNRSEPFRLLERKFVHLAEPQARYERWNETIDALVDALARERCVSFAYRGPKGTRRHEALEPLSLVVYRRALYLLARRPGGADPLRWRLDRMESVETGEPFAYPEDWDPHAALAPFFGIHSSPPPELVVLRFSPEVAHYVTEREWHGSARVEVRADGWSQLEMRAGGRELVRFVLEWGEHCRVIAPDWLAADVSRSLELARNHYN